METIRIAATALNTHKLRSFLTLLGVIIGVMTIIAVVSIISGLNNYIEEKVIQLNPDTYVVTQFGIITSREQFLEAVKRKKLDWNDYVAVRDLCQECSAVAANLSTRAAVKRGAERMTDVRVTGGTANMADVTNIDLEAGRMFSRSEDEHAALVTVIGSDVRDQLFGKLDPIGRTVWVSSQPMRVIGLVKKQGSILGNNQDNQLYMPLSTFRKQFGTRRTLSFFIKARGGVAGIERSMDDVRVIIRSRRRTAFRSDDPFGVVSAEAIQALWKSISAATFSVVALISSISLDRRRHRDHEHHAGVGDRANARDRHSSGARRDKTQHRLAVHFRGRAALAERRNRGRAARCADQPRDRECQSIADTGSSATGPHRSSRRGRDRTRRRILSRHARGGAPASRGFAL